MENNIIIKITSEAKLNEAQKQLNDLTKEAADFERQLETLSDRRKEDEAQLKREYKGHQDLEKILKKNKNLYRQEKRDLKESIAERKKSIKTLNDSIKAYKTLQGQSGKVVQQLRAMRERLMEMEDSGEFGTKAFMDLSIAAAKLEDQIGDTQQRIRILASDTKYLDAAIGLGDGLGGSFYIATSAAEVFGDDLEGLQKAFYKVQATMSILSGTQQVYNALQKNSTFVIVAQNALYKLSNKLKLKSAAASKADAAASVADSAAKGAQTTSTGILTAAQHALNAAMKANPIGAILAIIIAAVSAAIALAKGIEKLIFSFTAAGKAQAEYEKSMKRLEDLERKAAIGVEARAMKRRQQTQKTNELEKKALDDAKKRNASEIELADIKAKYAKQRADETDKYVKDEIKRNDALKAESYNAMEAKRREANAYKEGSKQQKTALEELATAEQKYYEYANKELDLKDEQREAEDALTDAQNEAAEERKQMALDAEQANIDLMRAGATKEIAQINLNFREKLKNVKGNSKEEKALRKALEAQQAKEIQAVRDKYAQQARQTEIQNRKNLLTLMSQAMGDEESYQEQIALEKKILKMEAQDQIKALEDSVKRKEMSEKDAMVKITAIRLQLQKDLNDIDEQDYQRNATIAQKRTEIFIKQAENEMNALNGSETSKAQLKVLDKYYDARKKQVEENATFEHEAAMRAFARGEMSAEQLADREKEIEANKQASLMEIAKEGASKRLEVEGQRVSALELEVAQAEDKASRAQGVAKLNALREQYDAQQELYEAQKSQLDQQYNAGLIKYQEYKEQEWEIMKATTDAEVQYRQDAMQTVADGFTETLNQMQQASDIVFEALSSGVQAELDELENMYTTDYEEAQKDANKKYITEKEYEKKKAALEEKAAKYAKAQALINAGINTALAITNALNTWPISLGIVMAGIAGAMGAAQMAVIANKPLAQYAKGRKGGKGEYAIVGEKGAELMYIPDGASIVPHDKVDKPQEWSKFDVPVLPQTSKETLHYASEQAYFGALFDYDRMGASVASHLPKQANVTVNVDRSGVHVNNGGDQHTYLNAKYQGSWH